MLKSYPLLLAWVGTALGFGLLVPPAFAGQILYVAFESGSTIEAFSPGGVGSVFATGAAVSVPFGFAFDSAGNLYEVNEGTDQILKFTPGGIASVFASSGLVEPSGIAIDSMGNVYVANFNNRIEKFTPAALDRCSQTPD